MAITPEMLALAQNTLEAAQSHSWPVARLRCSMFSKLIKCRVREWYNSPEGVYRKYLSVLYEAWTYDRLKNTTMGQNHKWDVTDHPSSIMAEFHVGVELGVSDAAFMQWEPSIAVYGRNGGNAGRDWPMALTGLDIDVEVKQHSSMRPLFVEKGKVCQSRYIVVLGTVPKYGFKIVGDFNWQDIKNKEPVLVKGELCHKMRLIANPYNRAGGSWSCNQQ